MKKFFFITVLILPFILNSCNSSRYIYTASPANNPYFTEKGQSKFTAYYSDNGKEISTSDNYKLTSRGSGTDLQSAYAIGDNWAITAGYYHRTEKDIALEASQNHIVNYKRNLFDVGGGAFMPLNKKKSFTFNFYAGIALGKFSFTDHNITQSDEHFHKASIAKWYLQPSINYIWNEYVRIGLILKNSFVHYGNIQTDYSDAEKQSYGLNFVENKTITFFEQEWNIQLGLPQLPWLKLDAALSMANPVFYDIQNLGSTRTGNVSIGLTFDLHKMKKKSIL